MSRQLRPRQRISYYEPDEPNLDEYVYCEKCADFVYEYCSIHGPLLVVPDTKVPAKTGYPDFVPRAALTIPSVFLHIAPSIIPGAGLGVFATMTLPRGVRFGPYRGKLTDTITSRYCWQLYDANRKPKSVVDAEDANSSNWMRYVNCSRHWFEQNLIAYQYQGQIYYRTIKIIPKFTELMVFYGSECADTMGIDLRKYNSPRGLAAQYGEPPIKKTKITHTDTKEKRNLQINTKIQPRCQETEINNAVIIETPKPIDINKTTCNQTDIEYICDDCGSKFDNKCLLTKHIEFHNLMKSKIQLSYNKGSLNASSLTRKDKSKMCEICNKGFTTSSHLKTHLRTHSGEKPYKCEICNKRFNESGTLKIHLRTHSGEKPYKCDICNMSYSHSISLKTHLTTHSGEKPYKCEICNKSFNQSSTLKTHLRRHSGEKPYKCDICNMSFSHSISLKIHLTTHSGEKPYKCDICNMSFNLSGNLKTHLKTHSGEKPYKCDICKMSFSQSSNLKTHLRTHSGEKPYKCDTCNMSFNRSDNLKTHLRTHSGEKPYKCDTCNMSFSQSGTLKTHLRTHSGEKPYKCDLCNIRFNHNNSLKGHLRKHSGE